MFWDILGHVCSFVPSGLMSRWKLANPHMHRCWQANSDRTNKTSFGTEGNTHYPTRMFTFWHKFASNSSHHQASKNERNELTVWASRIVHIFGWSSKFTQLMICSQVRPFASFTHWPSFITIHIHGKSIKIKYGLDRQSKSKFPNQNRKRQTICTVHNCFKSFPDHNLLGPPKRTTWKTVCNRAPSHICFN